MTEERILTDDELRAALAELRGWEVRDGWLRRTYQTPGWTHTMLLASAVAYVAEAAWHHPDLSIGYAQLTVKLQTHRVRGITASDVQLARRIDEVALWQPSGGALTGYPKKWVH